MAGTRIEEPRPRGEPGPWAPFQPRVRGSEAIPPPKPPPERGFGDVLASRRSGAGGPVEWACVAGLLGHAVGPGLASGPGRAGLDVVRRPSPSAGGLHPVRIVCVDDGGDFPRLYDPALPAFHVLDVDAAAVRRRNACAVMSVLGASAGCTLRLVADLDRAGAAYEAPVSLVLRDAGCLVATLCLVAEWLGLAACPLGFLGHDLVEALGFPTPRFMGVGAVQVGRRTVAAG